MLHEHGRVSYRALMRQFALDEAYLTDLKDALLYAYPRRLTMVGAWCGLGTLRPLQPSSPLRRLRPRLPLHRHHPLLLRPNAASSR